MYSRVNTAILYGLDAYVVEVESDLSRGLPQFNIVGLADTSIKESKERVRSAIKNSGYEFPLSRITINLAPADLKKDGSQMDLAIAVAILSSSGIIKKPIGPDCVFLGELFLDGKINRVRGGLPMVISMRDKGIKKCIIPFDNRDECGLLEDVEVIGVKNLSQLVKYLNGDLLIEPYIYEGKSESRNNDIDFKDIKGQPGLKRALEIAASGFHNLLMIGFPGSGKTMAAQRLSTIMPDLSLEESIEVTKIYSISGLLKDKGLIRERPFRAPHHTASDVSLIGGGRIPMPGEISLSHRGILFLDEIAEFDKRVLEVLRQPMEDGQVTISRANASLTYPSSFMLVGSMNPCPCGFLGSNTRECTCSQASIARYLNKLSGPLLDRIDIHVKVKPVKYKDLKSLSDGEESLEIRKRVKEAREIQGERYADMKINSNSEILDSDLDRYCALDSQCQAIMEMAFNKYKFSARSYNKILKVARTIADLEGSKNIRDKDILESINYRTMDFKY